MNLRITLLEPKILHFRPTVRTTIFVHSSFSSNTEPLGLQVWPLCCCSVEGDCDCICQWAITDGRSPIWIITLLARVKCYIHYHFQFPLPVFNLFFMAAPSWRTHPGLTVFWTASSWNRHEDVFLQNAWSCLLTASSWRRLLGSLRAFLRDTWRCLLDGVFLEDIHSSGGSDDAHYNTCYFFFLFLCAS